MKSIVTTFAVLLSLAGCATTHESEIAAFQRQDAVNLSVYELLATPKKYDGLPVRTIGVASFSFMFEGFSGLYATTDDFQAQTDGVIEISSLDPGMGSQEPKLVRLTGKYVLIEGVFHARPEIPEPRTDGTRLVCVGRCWGGGYIEQVSRVRRWPH